LFSAGKGSGIAAEAYRPGENSAAQGRFTPHEETSTALARESLLEPEELRADTVTGHAPAGGRAQARVTVLFFAAARQAAGVAKETVEAATLAEALEIVRGVHGDAFAAVLDGCRVWVNGEPAQDLAPLSDGDEIAVLPPVSGGSR